MDTRPKPPPVVLCNYKPLRFLLRGDDFPKPYSYTYSYSNVYVYEYDYGWVAGRNLVVPSR